MPKPRKPIKFPPKLDFEPADNYGLFYSEWAAKKQEGGRLDVDVFDADVCRLLNAAPLMLAALQSIATRSGDDMSWIVAANAIAKVARVRHA